MLCLNTNFISEVRLLVIIKTSIIYLDITSLKYIEVLLAS